MGHYDGTLKSYPTSNLVSLNDAIKTVLNDEHIAQEMENANRHSWDDEFVWIQTDIEAILDERCGIK